jgi:Holliday junction resolvase RusA-like endonuclease
MTLTIPGELCDLNRYIQAERSHRTKAAQIKRAETERVAWEIKAQPHEKPAAYPVHIGYVWYMKDQRKDLDNIAFAKKFINDGLVLAGILPGDGQKHIAGFTDTFIVDRERPRVEIVIN